MVMNALNCVLVICVSLLVISGVSALIFSKLQHVYADIELFDTLMEVDKVIFISSWVLFQLTFLFAYIMAGVSLNW